MAIVRKVIYYQLDSVAMYRYDNYRLLDYKIFHVCMHLLIALFHVDITPIASNGYKLYCSVIRYAKQLFY